MNDTAVSDIPISSSFSVFVKKNVDKLNLNQSDKVGTIQMKWNSFNDGVFIHFIW